MNNSLAAGQLIVRLSSAEPNNSNWHLAGQSPAFCWFRRAYQSSVNEHFEMFIGLNNSE
jgi:hypothetical protein